MFAVGVVWCSVFRCVALRCVAVCCGVLQCVAVCCSVLQCVAVCCSVYFSVLQCVAVRCSAVQCCGVWLSHDYRLNTTEHAEIALVPMIDVLSVCHFPQKRPIFSGFCGKWSISVTT